MRIYVAGETTATAKIGLATAIEMATTIATATSSAKKLTTGLNDSIWLIAKILNDHIFDRM